MNPAESHGTHQPVGATFTYWRESDGRFLGYLNTYPDHWTQGDDLEDLKAQLLARDGKTEEALAVLETLLAREGLERDLQARAEILRDSLGAGS